MSIMAEKTGDCIRRTNQRAQYDAFQRDGFGAETDHFRGRIFSRPVIHSTLNIVITLRRSGDHRR
jgi:hypothetical protein